METSPKIAALDRIFKAESVAIIGASKDEQNGATRPLKSSLDQKFDGRIYPVNPKENLFSG
jgi:acetate---CoA ligase (ADP-forming)